MEAERLQKYLAAAGVASRRASETLILEGRVAVNGKVVKELGTKVTPGKDKITVDGKAVQTEEQLVYYLMNKPAGYLTTVKDTHDRPTVMDLLVGIPYRVFPVGRLDFETEGLLLLTNDGEFAYRMTHPKFKIKKTYLATVYGEVTPERLQMLRDGVELEDGKTAPAEVNIVRQEKHRTVVEITIHEGKNRQVRRMFKAVKNPVLELKRINVGGLTLKGVDSGDIRSLTEEEVQKLTQRLGMHRDGSAQNASNQNKAPKNKAVKNTTAKKPVSKNVNSKNKPKQNKPNQNKKPKQPKNK